MYKFKKRKNEKKSLNLLSRATYKYVSMQEKVLWEKKKKEKKEFFVCSYKINKLIIYDYVIVT